MQARDIPVKSRFRLCNQEAVYTRVVIGFPMATGHGKGTPSNAHVFALNEDMQVVAIHPDNSVEPIA